MPLVYCSYHFAIAMYAIAPGGRAHAQADAKADAGFAALGRGRA